MTEPFDLSMPSGRRRDRWAWLLSALVHAAIIVAAVWQAEKLWHATPPPGPLAPGRPGGGGGGGGGRPAVVYILPPAAPAPAPVPVETPPVVPPVVEPTPVTPVPRPPVDSTPVIARADTGVSSGATPGEGAGTGGGVGGGTGGGVGAGTGAGVGPGTGTGGGGGTTMPPVWSAGALPFSQTPPKDLRGKHVTVRFWVRPDGTVEQTEVVPSIADGKYAEYFKQVMLTYRFKPARDPSGQAVAGTYEMGIDLPSK